MLILSRVRRLRPAILGLFAMAAIVSPSVSPVHAVASSADPEGVLPIAPLAQVAAEMEIALRRAVSPAEILNGRKALGDQAATSDAVATYLRQAEAAGILAQQARELVGDARFGGVTLDVQNQRIRVFIAGPDSEAVIRTLNSNLPRAVLVTEVSRPLAELRLLHHGIVAIGDNLLQAGVVLVTVGEDVASNTVTVGVASDLALAKAVLDGSFPEAGDHMVVEHAQSVQPGVTVVCSDANGCNLGGPTVTLTNMTEARLCGEPGDSGGAVHWGSAAHGITSLSGGLDETTHKCGPQPMLYFNLISDLEVELGVRVFES